MRAAGFDLLYSVPPTPGMPEADGTWSNVEIEDVLLAALELQGRCELLGLDEMSAEAGAIADDCAAIYMGRLGGAS